MSLPSFTGLSPAATRGCILHISDATLPTATIYTGEGVATCFSFTATGISITGEVEADSLSLSGNAAIAGTLTLGGIPVLPVTRKILSSTVMATDTTAVALTALSFTPVSGATYDVEFVLFATAATQTGSLHIRNTGGAGTLYLLAPTPVYGTAQYGILATSGEYAPTYSPIAGTFLVHLKGIFVASSTTALDFAIHSSNTDDVSILAGSHAAFTRIA